MTDVDKKKIEKYKNLIIDIPGINSAEYVNSTTSSVTLSWGVEWSPDYIARDIIQNFRDANHTEIDAINCAIVREAVRHGVSTPVNDMLCKLVRAARSNDKNHENGLYSA